MGVQMMGNETTIEEAEARILRELNILLKLSNPYIVDFLGVDLLNNHRIAIMLEYMDIGTLESVYERCGPIPVGAIGTISLHILRGLLYLEEEGIHHRGKNIDRY